MTKLFFDFGEIRPELVSERCLHLRISGFPADFKELYLQMHGWYSRILALSGATGIESRFVSKSWEGAGDTCIEYRWESE